MAMQIALDLANDNDMSSGNREFRGKIIVRKFTITNPFINSHHQK